MFEYYGNVQVYCPGVEAHEEKMFEYFGNIHAYCPRVGPYELLRTNLFQNH